MTTPNDLNLRVTEERVKDMDLETFYNVEKSNRALIDFVAHFCTDEDGNYYERNEAVKQVISGRKIRDVESIYEDLNEAMEQEAVPKV